MIAVFGIGKPNGRLNSTTTAPIGKAADRCGLREGGEKSKAGVATLEKLRDHVDGEAREEDPPANHLMRPSAQSRVIALVERR